jgi:phage shock protein PspC (stress-responsive transcriptional regulator)
MDQSPPDPTPSEPRSTDPGPPSSGPGSPGATDHGSGPTGPGPTGSAPGGERLHRCRDGRMVAGVAAGLADFFDIDATIVRIGFVALAFLGGLAVPLYLAGWLLIPEEETDVSVAEELLARERAR